MKCFDEAWKPLEKFGSYRTICKWWLQLHHENVIWTADISVISSQLANSLHIAPRECKLPTSVWHLSDVYMLSGMLIQVRLQKPDVFQMCYGFFLKPFLLHLFHRCAFSPRGSVTPWIAAKGSSLIPHMIHSLKTFIWIQTGQMLLQTFSPFKWKTVKLLQPK